MPASGLAFGALERILALKRLPTFAALPAAELAVIAEQARERFLPKGTLLLREGEPIGSIHFVLEGRVHMSRAGQVMGHGGPGAAVGGLGVLARAGAGFEAVAETDTLTLELDADALLEIFEDHFQVLHHVLKEICRLLIDLWTEAPEDLEGELPRVDLTGVPSRELDLVERIFFLRKGAAFARSSINALAELSRGLTEVRFDPGLALWQEGEPSGAIFLLASGSVACSAANGLRFQAGAGSPIGALESVAERPRWYDAVPRTPVVALHGSVDGLIDVFEDNVEMALDYTALISRLVLRALERSSPGALERFFGCTEEPPGST